MIIANDSFAKFRFKKIHKNTGVENCVNQSIKQFVEQNDSGARLTEEPTEKEIGVIEKKMMLIADQIVFLMNVKEVF